MRRTQFRITVSEMIWMMYTTRYDWSAKVKAVSDSNRNALAATSKKSAAYEINRTQKRPLGQILVEFGFHSIPCTLNKKITNSKLFIFGNILKLRVSTLCNLLRNQIIRFRLIRSYTGYKITNGGVIVGGSSSWVGPSIIPYSNLTTPYLPHGMAVNPKRAPKPMAFTTIHLPQAFLIVSKISRSTFAPLSPTMGFTLGYLWQ